jgi:uncharacterized protein
VITESVAYASDDRLTLEGVLDSEGAPSSLLLLCHPHPQMGGTMNAPLLLAIRDHMVARGWGVLRFNFRGIGKSEGETGAGEAEMNDVRAGLRVLRERFPGLPLAVAGWSFGAAVALRVACKGEDLSACIAVAPPVTPKPGVTVGLPPPESCKPSCPVLVVTGANDDQVSPGDCRSWAKAVSRARYTEIPGANHFFWAKYEALSLTIAEFADEAVAKEA